MEYFSNIYYHTKCSGVATTSQIRYDRHVGNTDARKLSRGRWGNSTRRVILQSGR
jgi:hypothetical protein